MKRFIQNLVTICLLYLNTVVLFYSVHSAWRTYYVYNTFGSPNLDNATHIFIARLLILSPIAMISFVLATYMLIKIVKRVTYNVKKEIRTSEYKKRLAEKHDKFQQMINNSYMLEADKDNSQHTVWDRNPIYSPDGILLGYIIEEGYVSVK